MIKVITLDLDKVKVLQNLNDEVFVDNHKYDSDLKVDWAQSETGRKYFTEVLNNPEKCVRVMIETCLAGHWDWWIAHKNGRYLQFIPKTSRMWKLKIV